MTTDVYIVSACRTGIGAFNGQFASISSVTLGATVIEETVKRSGIKPEDLDEVIMGQVLTGGLGQNTARQAALTAKIPITVPARTVNMVCGSGLRSVYDAYNSIKSNDSKIVLAGGMENMSQTRHCTYARNAKKLGSIDFDDLILLDGLTDPLLKIHMGITAEHLAKKYNLTREQQDLFALSSQVKAGEAIAKGYFKDEIVAVNDPKLGSITKDEHVRASTTIEGLAKLRPAFDKNGSVTAGNASGINDGAAAVVLCDGNTIKSRNITPLAKIVGFAQSGCEPIEMGLGPIPAIKKLLDRVGWNVDDVDLFELNEAFAAQSLVVVNSLGINSDKVNITGGAIALGHPIGASGTRILVTLVHNLKRTGKSKGIASLCIGGGMGIAIAVQAN